MELKEYQQGVLNKLDHYLTTLATQREDAETFVAFQHSRGKEAAISDYPREAWDQLNKERVLPYGLDRDGKELVLPYLVRHDGLEQSIPNICLKVPTGGGKTLLAACALERIQTDFFKRQTGFILWVVPSDAIYRQTWKYLANREHPYRQILERASGGRVKLLEKGDAFTRRDVEGQLCVMVLMLPSAARKSKETLRLFRDSGRFTSFFPAEDDSEANRALWDRVKNIDLNDLADMGWMEGIVPGSLSIKQSLGNTLRLVRPVIVVDEGHKAYSDTARDTLCNFNPRFILELSATPNTNGKHQSNVLVNVPGGDLKEEEMIKLPINVINEDKGGWQQTLTLAHAKLAELHDESALCQNEQGRYIRPIMLIRVERTGKDQRDKAFIHAEDVKEYLLEKLGVNAEHIRLKTSENDELGSDDLLVETCPVRYIITKDALREGWDCPFAYVLAILSKTTANTALTQMVGRVLRQPHARLTNRPALNECYVFTFDQDVSKAVEGVRKGLQDEGMADLASSIQTSGAGGAIKSLTRKETLQWREKYRHLPKIFLPRVLHRDVSEEAGYRLLDYDRDILGELDWEAFRFLQAEQVHVEMEDKLKRTIARINIEKKDKEHSQTVFQLDQQEFQDIPDNGLDRPFLVRQLLDVIPNPWQGMRILDETLCILRDKGISEQRLYINRLDLLQVMKEDLKAQVHKAAENLFRKKLESGDISLRLVASTFRNLNWELAKTLEIELADTDRPLYRKDGNSLEKSLFETLYARDFNELEKNTAWYLDTRETIYWWHRIAVNNSSYSLQGWQRNRVFPDLLACVHEPQDGKYRFSVLETKGSHLKGNDDTEYKRKLFGLLTSHCDRAITAGEFDFGEDRQGLTFTMLMEDSWAQELADEGIK
ncbi:DEAD/DEAH box helicase family protein [Desulfuromonas acetoxidans]|uniref:DEAD/DEAH box helicase n=1 Tax=Desulfuromonas acetoxidans TaxID=891 RepID=UPI002931B1A9|nr:DEAD/DEAH box helicase family protein [Desulfuromonas acetoxidans]